MQEETFDYEGFKKGALERLKNGEELTGKDGVFTPLIKNILEASLEGELEAHLMKTRQSNRRNGKMSKQLKTAHGTIDLNTPRDRESSFEPQLIKKRQTSLGKSLDDKILALYGFGMSYRDICEHLNDLYGIELSEATLSGITDKIIPLVKEWQSRPLEAIYPIVWLDAIHYKVKEDARVLTKAVHCVLGVNLEGRKELLGMYISEREAASFWLSVLTDLKSRGVQDIFIACIDNLTGFKDAIATLFPQTDIQQCIIHQIRNSLRYVPYKQQKAFIADLKTVYKAVNLEQAEVALLDMDEKWGKKYPTVLRSWKENWTELSAFFKYAEPIRRVIYTTNTIEGFHAQLRKVTKTKRVFSSDMALLKLLYLIQENITKKWTMPMYDWKNTLSQFSIIFADRCP